MLIAANPVSGGFRHRLVEKIATDFRRSGRRADVVYTTEAGEITRLLQTPSLDIDAIAVHGGDGTIGEAVAGLHMLRGKRPALLVIPGGTANVLACELKLPRSADGIVALALAGHTRPFHYALANGRPFFLMASAGFDAAVVHAVSSRTKRRFGRLAFLIAAMRTLRGDRTADLQIETDDGVCVARIAVVTNSSCYGGPHVLTRATAVDRSGLRLVTLPHDDVASLLRIGRAMVARTSAPDNLMIDRPVTSARLVTDRPVPVQIDGDAFGTTPLVIESVAEPLAILAPL
jgi:diacylglycerol kinase (ATP)